MGSIGGMFGTAGGASGSGFSAPKDARVQQATSVNDVQNAQGNVSNSLASQQNLLNALQDQNATGYQTQLLAQQQGLANGVASNNGLGNQANAMNQQQAMNAQLAAANGVGTQNQAISGLQGVANRQQGTESMYQNVAEGRGPNPAQAMLNQQTGANVANQAALMAGQRGAGANVGLMARQAAQQGAATQQQAVAQGATMQANQQLNALSGLSSQQANQVGTQQALGGLGTTQAGMQQAGITNQANQSNQQIAQLQASQQAAAAQANAMAGQQIGATQANTEANLASAQQQQNALAAVNNANVSSQGNVNTGNAGLAQTTMQGQQKGVGGLFNSVSGLFAGGGEVQNMADGGPMAPMPAVPPAPPPGPSSSFGQFLSKTGGANVPGIQQTAYSFAPEWQQGPSEKKEKKEGSKNVEIKSTEKVAGPDAKDMGVAPPPAGGSANPSQIGFGADPSVMTAAKGGLASGGGHVSAKKPSQNPEKKGNSYDNDKIPAMLSAGEIVLPRDVTMSKDPVRASADFVAKVLAKRKVK